MDKFDIGNFMMHKNAMDVCLEVSFKNGHLTYVKYWNLGYSGKPWLLDSNEYIIHTEVLNSDDWNILTPEQLTTPRANSGLPGTTC